jgi:NAD(P)-dependent dehydrogenase (short-subunit alcohol dehydrogenase family)
MQDFAGKLAVITGAGTGMGRELAKQLTPDVVAFRDAHTAVFPSKHQRRRNPAMRWSFRSGTSRT